jgi:hypothetical protein
MPNPRPQCLAEHATQSAATTGHGNRPRGAPNLAVHSRGPPLHYRDRRRRRGVRSCDGAPAIMA